MAVARQAVVYSSEETFDNPALNVASAFTDAIVGGNTAFTGVTGSATDWDFPLYDELARTPGEPMPYRGSYCARCVNTSVGPDESYFENTSASITQAGVGDTVAVRFLVYFSEDWTMDTSDFMELFSLRSAGAAEAVIGLDGQADGSALWYWGETDNDVTGPAVALGRWISMEVHLAIVGAAGGTIDVWIDGVAQTQSSGATGTTLAEMRLGVSSGDAGTTGTIYLDQVVIAFADTATSIQNIGPLSQRFPRQMVTHSSQQVCVGSGKIDNVTLVSNTSADGQLVLYDTDTAYIDDDSRIVTVLKATAADEIVDPAGMPVHFSRGLYADLTPQDDTVDDPLEDRAILNLCYASGYGSEGVMRSHAQKRKALASGA